MFKMILIFAIRVLLVFFYNAV